MDKRDEQRIRHILTYCEDIADFLERFGRNFETFITDRAYFSAVSMSILQIGELSGGLTEAFRTETGGEIPWPMIRGMRNWLAHAYSEIDEEMLWETAIADIPKLADFCRKQLQNP